MKKIKPLHLMVSGRVRKTKAILEEWFFPPNISAAITCFVRLFIKKTKKEWLYEPVDIGLHRLPYFDYSEEKPLWLSVNKESRPAIIIKTRKSFVIDLGKDPAQYIQIGIG